MSGRILAHLDDVGATRGSVEAWRALRAAGVVRSASVMVPCPWYRFAVEDYRSDPAQDLGIHLTLTSEWSAYRWRPMIGPVGGLVDEEGFFHRRPEAVAAQADPGAVADEIAAQIERAMADGIRPTHLDAHMGTAYLRPFVPALIEASERYDIPLMMCRDWSALTGAVRGAPGSADHLAEIAQDFAARCHPVLDRFLIGFCPPGGDYAAHLDGMLTAAGPGDHWLALHANAPDDTPGFAPHMVEPRAKERDFFADKKSRENFTSRGFSVVDWPEFAAGR